MRKMIITVILVLILAFSSFTIVGTSQITGNENINQAIDNLHLKPAEESNYIYFLENNDFVISKNDQILAFRADFIGTNHKFQLLFQTPTTNKIDDFSLIDISGCGYSMLPEAPMMPQRTITLTYEPGTKIEKVAFQQDKVENLNVELPILPVPKPYPVIDDMNYFDEFEGQVEDKPQMDLDIYNSKEFYPNEWFNYYTGMGLSPVTDERVEFLIIHIFPARYNPILKQIDYITSGELEVTIQEPEQEQEDQPDPSTRASSNSDNNNRATTHDMVVICPSTFKAELNDFVKHKTNTGVDSVIITLDDINSGTYFTVQGRDQAEKMKYFIYNAIQSWDIKYVLLVGDAERVPTRITHVEESGLNDNEASDLYFADVFASGSMFCDWDYDSDDRFGEYSGGNVDKADLFPDIHIGRFPASTASEVSTLVDKTKTYEITAIGKPFYKKTVLNGLDTFSGGTPEGEYLSDHIAKNYLQDFDNTKLYESTNTLTKQNIKNYWSNGAGYVSFSDHGLHSSWGSNHISSADVSTLTNGYELSFVNYDACLTGEFDQGSSDCIAEQTILNPNGGGVAVVASSRIAYGSWGRSHINSVSGYLNVRLYHNMKHETEIAGALLTLAKTDYMRNIGSGSATHFKTVVEYNYFGDPSLLLGGLPTAIYNLKCEDNTSDITPGQAAEYRIQVENTDIQTRQIILTTSNPPLKWTVKLSDKTITLLPGTKKNVTLTITAPSDALAGVKADITVIGSLPNIERNICVGTQTTVKRIYGFDISSDGHPIAICEVYPGNLMNITFQINNLGNAEEQFSFKLISEQEETLIWDYKFSSPSSILPAFEAQEMMVSIEVPIKAVSKDYLFNVSAKLQSTGKTKTMGILLSVLRVYSVEINCSNPNLVTDPGRNISFFIKLENQGNHLESYDLLFNNLPDDWSVVFRKDAYENSTFLVGPYNTIDIRTVITVPKGTIVGDYNLTLFAQCNGLDDEHKVFSSVNLNVEVNRVYGIELRSDIQNFNVTPGESIKKYIQVINLGNYRDFANLEVIDKPDNWVVTLEKYNDLLLFANDNRDIGFSITPNANTVVGTYDIYVRGIIQGDESYSDLKLEIEVSRITGLNITNSDTTIEFKAGESWDINAVISNLGNDKDVVTLSFPSKYPYGSVSIEDSTVINLKPFGNEDIKLKLDLNERATAGTQYIPITAMLGSTGENTTFMVEFNILQTRGVLLDIVKNKIESQPGDEVKCIVKVRNLGNSKESFKFEVADIPEGWEKRFPVSQTVILEPYSETNLSLLFSVPSDEPYHDVNLDFRIQSNSDSRINYILPVTISIKEEEFGIAGMELEFFSMLILIVILIIVALIGIVRVRNKRKNAQHRQPNVIQYSSGSDGSRVQWDEKYEPIGDQYNPPTMMQDQGRFELQIQSPDTYRQKTYGGSRSQGYQNAQISRQSVDTLPLETQVQPSAADYGSRDDLNDLNFKKPNGAYVEGSQDQAYLDKPYNMASTGTATDTATATGTTTSTSPRKSQPFIQPGATYPVLPESAYNSAEPMEPEVFEHDIIAEPDYRYDNDYDLSEEHVPEDSVVLDIDQPQPQAQPQPQLRAQHGEPQNVIFQELESNEHENENGFEPEPEYHESKDGGLKLSYSLPKKDNRSIDNDIDQNNPNSNLLSKNLKEQKNINDLVDPSSDVKIFEIKNEISFKRPKQYQKKEK
jgi:uncharacterized membrane protein